MDKLNEGLELLKQIRETYFLFSAISLYIELLNELTDEILGIADIYNISIIADIIVELLQPLHDFNKILKQVT